MNDLFLRIDFWIEVALACLIKVKASPRLGIINAILTIAIAIGAALVLTGPVLEWRSLSSSWAPAVAALVALTFEHAARQVLDMKLLDIIKAWRGKA